MSDTKKVVPVEALKSTVSAWWERERGYKPKLSVLLARIDKLAEEPQAGMRTQEEVEAKLARLKRLNGSLTFIDALRWVLNPDPASQPEPAQEEHFSVPERIRQRFDAICERLAKLENEVGSITEYEGSLGELRDKLRELEGKINDD